MLQAFLDWALEWKGKEHVYLPEFVRHFGLLNRDAATKSFQELIQHSCIPKKRRDDIQEAYRFFQEHHREAFWANRAMKHSTTMTSKQAVISTNAIISASLDSISRGVKEDDTLSFVGIPAIKLTADQEESSPEASSHQPKRRREESSDSLATEEDPVDRLLMCLPQPMSAILGSHGWTFVAAEDGLDIGAMFGNYYRKCANSVFKASYPEDALALNATLLIREDPTPLQLECFGEEFFERLKNRFKNRIPTIEISNERTLIRNWMDNLVDNEWDSDITLNHLENSKVTVKLCPLKRYLVYALSEFEHFQKPSYSEADGISSFLMPLLRKFYHVQGSARLAYTNNSSRTSIYHRRILDLETKTCGQPDLTTRSKRDIELFFAEAAGVMCHDTSKQAGDLVRLGVYGKNAIDQVDDIYDTSITVTLAHVVGRNVTMYIQFPLGTMYIMLKVGAWKIPDSLETLGGLAQDIGCIVKTSSVFHEQLKLLSTRVANKSGKTKDHFPSIITPHAKSALKQ
ncbi:hypothetical protein BX616_002366 [Lobosporangium transversale]|uniref:Uncharacterized protein n=1 Tax=Lobosporangium transversale TaxID=64571 RepID=A0A1Y2G9R6_9FUNG|nr:hypothetical protein BCR41DRAFT_400796 [Lobosporangium transversale]KAF9901148.1 hypothetical protein BX616_002366 [Lobosporangium transversale]ORZ05007.1 hypothetical protein BCR41DRAFT_400796 [Lobosporangium transversale]|eukprot:XP_021876871.1 hypothetical protein BCR41DRAFT_400796 [Lobosporangium transversale]